MGKTVTFHHVMDIEHIVREEKVGGLIKKSNFIPEGERHMFPLHEPVFDTFDEGSTIRVTLFVDEDTVEKQDGRLTFVPKGVRYEIWNENNKGWDKVFEKLKK